jgi:hypothetical protein
VALALLRSALHSWSVAELRLSAALESLRQRLPFSCLFYNTFLVIPRIREDGKK